jgi:hypothetical protein
MTLELTKQEKDYLRELLESAHGELIHEIHHTDTADYEELLKQKVALVEGLKAKVERLVNSA